MIGKEWQKVPDTLHDKSQTSLLTEKLPKVPPSTAAGAGRGQVPRTVEAWLGDGNGYFKYVCVLCHLWPHHCSPLGFSVCGFLQARILEWVAMPSSRGPAQPWNQTHISYVSCIGRWMLYHWATRGVLFLSICAPSYFLQFYFLTINTS